MGRRKEAGDDGASPLFPFPISCPSIADGCRLPRIRVVGVSRPDKTTEDATPRMRTAQLLFPTDPIRGRRLNATAGSVGRRYAGGMRIE